MNEGGGIRLVPGLAVRAGQTLAGKYRVEELIGRGPSGVVISAHNVHLREQVALKILASYTDDQDELLKRRLKKARIATGLKSAHVARIVDIGFTEDGMPYVATEALEGTTLEAELAERGAVPVQEAARWVLEACEGLAEAHAAGLVHGDLKPQNIFLARSKPSKCVGLEAAAPVESGAALDADARVLKILDFGSTSPLDAIGDQSASAFFGSPAFVAPEQIQAPGDVDARADVWALGVLLYNLVSGSLPFEADTLSGVIVAVVYDAPSLLTDAPYELARLVHRCLEKDPAKRPQDVRELAAALAPFAGVNGAGASDRVGAMLDAGSISPVALSPDTGESGEEDFLGADDAEVPLPLLTKRSPDRTVTNPSTRPSQRVAARRRRSRSRVAAFAVLGGAAAVALAAWTTRSMTLPSMAVMAPAEVRITSAPMAAALPAAIPLTRAADLPEAPDAITPPAPAPASPEVSFAASSAESIIPTPPAVTPTPIATSEPFPPGSTLPFASPDEPPAEPPVRLGSAAMPAPPAPIVLPAPRSVTPASLPNAPPVSPRSARTNAAAQRSVASATTPLQLPPGLPTTRDGRSDRSDESYLRKLFTDRK